MRSKNIKFTIAYDGTRYPGWQRLGKDQDRQGIQQIVEVALSEAVGQPVLLTGSGRTDAGVHAVGQVANGRVPAEVKTESLRAQMNRLLPSDVQILKAEEVADSFHSRYDATEKVYEYWLYCGEKPDVFLRKRVLAVGEPLALDKMKEAAALLAGTHDFAGYASAMSDGRSTIKTLCSIEIEADQRLLILRYRGDGFLYNMVRILTGTLLEVGKGSRTLEQVQRVFETKNRQDAGPTVPGVGLHLKEVVY